MFVLVSIELTCPQSPPRPFGHEGNNKYLTDKNWPFSYSLCYKEENKTTVPLAGSQEGENQVMVVENCPVGHPA